MTKQEIYTNTNTAVLELLTDNPKLPKAFKDALQIILDTNLKPKKGGGPRGETHPAILDDAGLIVEAYCRYHDRYEDVASMIITKRGIAGEEKSKGHCIAVNYRWAEIDKAIKECQIRSFKYLDEGEFEKAQSDSKEAKRLKELQYLGEASEIPDFEGKKQVTLYNFEQDYADLKTHNLKKEADKLTKTKLDSKVVIEESK